MNLSQKIPLIHHIIKDLTRRSSFARKARMLLKAKEIERLVRLSPVFSTPASFRPRLRWEPHDRGSRGRRRRCPRAPSKKSLTLRSRQAKPQRVISRRNVRPQLRPYCSRATFSTFRLAYGLSCMSIVPPPPRESWSVMMSP